MAPRSRSLTLPPSAPKAAMATPTPTPRKFDPQRTATCLKMVSDSTRIQIIRLLAEGDLSVTGICEGLGGLSQPAVSHHLALLKLGGFAQWRRSGKQNFYAITDKARAICRMIDDLDVALGAGG